MFKLIITKKLFWIVASFIIVANLAVTTYLYTQTYSLIEKRALSRAQNLQSYFMSMRYVYHQQFLQSGYEIDDVTVGFLPAHASTLISDTFASRVEDGTTIRNVSDNPRNLLNQADIFEMDAIQYFENHPQKNYLLQTIIENNQESFFYTAPIKVEPYCISCHGKKEEVLPYVASRYDTAYGYEVGDIRGVTSIKIPKKVLKEDTLGVFWKNTYFSWSIMFVMLAMLYYVIREITIKDALAKRKLEEEVRIKTADLVLANERQKQLFSILRTVADCNQVLITASNLDELINETAQTMHQNSVFSGVKIILFEEERLKVKASIGLDEEFDVYPLEEEVFHSNKEIRLHSFDETLPKECLDKVKKYNIKEVYILPLRRDSYAKEALGVMRICTTNKEGFNSKEEQMIVELSGELGFAINSFMQKAMIDRLAYYNSLTNLPNKKLLKKNIAQDLNHLAQTSKYGAILYLNIDNFKSINDTKGMSVGDSVLKEFANRLIENLEQDQTVYHIGGDEFVLLINKLSKKSNKSAVLAQHYANSVIQCMKSPITIDSEDLYLTVSIGVKLFNDIKQSVDELLNNAESAMHIAKNSGKNSVSFYDPKLQEMAINRAFIIRNLQEAFQYNQFFMLYQKQYDNDQKVVGVEALIRWQHSDLGIVSPATFIPLAEESGFIIELGQWVVKEALELLQRFQKDEHKKQWRVSVNVSPIQFKDKNFVHTVEKLTKEYGIDPRFLRLELTEGILINDLEEVLGKLQRLKKLGFSISIDDFGTGYSSLLYLKKMPIDELKIDQSFVANLSKDNADKTIVQTVIAMGETFGLSVLAEGVETKEHFDILKDLGCKNYQGYYFAKPCEIKEL